MSARSLADRIWARDVTVWAPAGTPEIADRLGWLDAPALEDETLDEVLRFADEIRGEVDRVVLCGMGGSSLAPEVLWRTFGHREGYPVLHLLDSTHPDAVRAADPTPGTLYVVASKSGTTLETQCFLEHAWAVTGADGARLVAITDPDTDLARLAADRGFRRVFLNRPDVGGRFSALTLFGLVPAALIGIDVAELLARARLAARACQLEEGKNFWLRLGLGLGEAGRGGRDKVTFLLSPGIESFGLWLEQLVAESTGKQGTGLLPVLGERPDAMARYGGDRLFVRVGVLGDPMAEDDEDLAALEQEGHVVLRTDLDDPLDLGAQFFGWEFATAVAGHVLGVNPFTQPNVAESKRNTLRVLTDGAPAPGVAPRLEAFLDAVSVGDYLALQGFVPPTPDWDRILSRLQGALARRTGVPVTVGYGPRFLHSTGQFHKGGPASGHFLQLLEPVADDLAVPGAGYTFGQLLAAQADGDREALAARGRPVLRVDDLAALERYL